MGGNQISNRGPGDDGYDDEGYDEEQRAEILEATRDGPSDGTILTDLDPDLGMETDDEEDPDEDEESMTDGETGEEDDDAEPSEDDMDEDDAQDDFEAGTLAKGDDLDDRDDVATNP